MTQQTMSDEQLMRYREALLARRREIVGDLASMRDEQSGRGGAADQMASRAPSHPADEATDEHGRAVLKQLTQRERDIAVEIDEALTRMDHGAYGLCQECGEPIDTERLDARPWSRLCLRHAAEAE